MNNENCGRCEHRNRDHHRFENGTWVPQFCIVVDCTCREFRWPTNYERVRAFHRMVGAPIRREPQHRIPEEGIRISFIEEEFREYVTALTDGDVVEVADALADLLYVVYGTALHHGINIDAVFQEVHRSNMTKTPNGAGKAIKGPTFNKPQIADVLAKQPGHRFGGGW